MNHLENHGKNKDGVKCGKNPIDSLVTMFVDMVQKGRIDKGQCPAMRPVFLKPHGVAHGVFKVKDKLDKHLRHGLFAKGKEYPVWARFSSDTLPTLADFKTTIGIGLKLFDTPTPKVFGLPDETTSDFIMQNMDVFFVDTAKDMCQFTKAGVVDGDYGPYLKKHPKTAKILDEMAKPVGSVLASPYWGILPFSLGKSQYVKYKLEPTIKVTPPDSAPVDPTYLARDMEKRLAKKAVSFKFMIQLRTSPKTMPLDEATVPWCEKESPYIHVADVTFPVQDISERNQMTYGENLSFNIWRVPKDNAPAKENSIAQARKVVYAASAEQRRNVNGIPDGDPVTAKPAEPLPPCKDTVIVRAAIHPAIGVARVGDAKNAFFVGPEVTTPENHSGSYYRTSTGALKRQAARFRLYGYNAAGEVVRELTPNNADITWTVHVANRKADWYQFITALDVPEMAGKQTIRRNKSITGQDRQSLVIDPGPRSISGTSTAGGKGHKFNTGEFKGNPVYLGELQTDENGCLLYLPGHGKSVSPSGNPPYDPADPDSFNNANDWYDDMADGPVDAKVSIDGKEIEVEGAWVISAPPNYAPDVIGWRTMYDLMVDVYTANGWMPVPDTTSFSKDVLPQLQRLSNLQWVNKGFYAMFGKARPMDFEDPQFIAQLARTPVSKSNDPFGELRRQLLNAFRPYQPKVNEPRIWPWIYGDTFDGDLFDSSPTTMLALPSLQQLHLQRWANGAFINDWDPDAKPPATLSDVDLAEQPAMLDQASMHYCLADAFHPGCEMTWPMRHVTMYHSPFRIRRLNGPQNPDQYGQYMTQEIALSPDGPLHAQGPGDITRWMGLPWQGDTAYCRSGYDPDFDLFLPTYWPARVPNTVLSQADYEMVIDESLPREERLAAYSRRASWYRFIDTAPTIATRMDKMIAHFGAQGIVEARPGIADDPDFPSTIYVENVPDEHMQRFVKVAKMAAEAATGSRQAVLEESGWTDEQHLQDALNLRARRRTDQ